MSYSLLRSVLVTLVLSLAAGTASAQIPNPNLDPDGYDAWKQSVSAPARVGDASTRDATAARVSATAVAPLVPFPGSGGWTQIAPNDDGYSLLIPLGFSFEFYGTTYTSLYVNNNGNLSFGTPYSTYSPVGFPSSSYVMIAPFWGDVDTRAGYNTSTGVGLTNYKSMTLNGDQVFVAHWEQVGYFANHTDKLNTFQVVIADDATLPGGNNVCFGYGDMQWTTGDASSGVNGFGGSPATVGANKGDGVSYFLTGRFDHAGTDYDGPVGTTDGVSYLDGTQVCFNTGASSTNIPPVVSSAPSNPVTATEGDPISFAVTMTGPESDQMVSLTQGGDAVPGLTCTLVDSPTPGALATASCSAPTGVPAGTYTVEITGMDNGSPSLSTTRAVVLEVASGSCSMPSILSETVNSSLRTVAVTFDAGNGALLDEISFRDPIGNVFLNNFTVTDSDGFTSANGIDWMAPAIAPNEATFVLQATGQRASYFAIITNDCGSVYDADPIHDFARASASIQGEGSFPNPFSESTTIRFSLEEAAPNVRVVIYDLVGREIAELHHGPLDAGTHDVVWTGVSQDGQRVSSGVYLYRVEAPTFSIVRHITLVR